MITRVFTCETHSDFGSLGWRPKNDYDADPLSGMATAHDTLEHFEDDIGRISDELQAFGAMMWGRGEGGWFWQNTMYCPGANMASDLPELYSHYHHQGMYFGPAPRRTNRLNDECECWLDKFRSQSIRNAKDMYGVDMSDVRRFIGWCRDWMRIGYRRARRRFRNISACQFTYAFEEISRRADKLLTHAYEGMTLTIKVDIRTLNDIRIHTSEADEWH